MRPTPDRVRETLFNWLGQDLSGLRCLDLFAGSGALGLEAASRGARAVVLVEHDRRAIESLRANVRMLQAESVEVVHADALEFLGARRGVHDVVFLDPPYSLWEQSAGTAALLLSRLREDLAPGARVYLESPAVVELPQGWQALRRARAGAVHYQLVESTSE